jgi:hypothetical protein
MYESTWYHNSCIAHKNMRFWWFKKCTYMSPCREEQRSRTNGEGRTPCHQIWTSRGDRKGRAPCRHLWTSRGSHGRRRSWGAVRLVARIVRTPKGGGAGETAAWSSEQGSIRRRRSRESRPLGRRSRESTGRRRSRESTGRRSV